MSLALHFEIIIISNSRNKQCMKENKNPFRKKNLNNYVLKYHFTVLKERK